MAYGSYSPYDEDKLPPPFYGGDSDPNREPSPPDPNPMPKADNMSDLAADPRNLNVAFPHPDERRQRLAGSMPDTGDSPMPTSPYEKLPPPMMPNGMNQLQMTDARNTQGDTPMSMGNGSTGKYIRGQEGLPAPDFGTDYGKQAKYEVEQQGTPHRGLLGSIGHVASNILTGLAGGGLGGAILGGLHGDEYRKQNQIARRTLELTNAGHDAQAAKAQAAAEADRQQRLDLERQGLEQTGKYQQGQLDYENANLKNTAANQQLERENRLRLQELENQGKPDRNMQIALDAEGKPRYIKPDGSLEMRYEAPTPRTAATRQPIDKDAEDSRALYEASQADTDNPRHINPAFVNTLKQYGIPYDPKGDQATNDKLVAQFREQYGSKIKLPDEVLTGPAYNDYLRGTSAYQAARARGANGALSAPTGRQQPQVTTPPPDTAPPEVIDQLVKGVQSMPEGQRQARLATILADKSLPANARAELQKLQQGGQADAMPSKLPAPGTPVVQRDSTPYHGGILGTNPNIKANKPPVANVKVVPRADPPVEEKFDLNTPPAQSPQPAPVAPQQATPPASALAPPTSQPQMSDAQAYDLEQANKRARALGYKDSAEMKRHLAVQARLKAAKSALEARSQEEQDREARKRHFESISSQYGR